MMEGFNPTGSSTGLLADVQRLKAHQRIHDQRTGGDGMTQQQPPQHQNHQPGDEHRMDPKPEYIRESYRGSGKLLGKVAQQKLTKS